MKTTRALVLLTTLGGLSSACIQVEVDVPEVCVRQRGLEMVGVPDKTFGAGIVAHLEQSFTVDGLALLDALKQVEASCSADLRRVTLYASSGTESLSFVQQALLRVEADHPEKSMDPLEIGCDLGECQAVGPELELAPVAVPDVVDYFAAEKLTFTIQLTGVMPPETWTLDADVCLATSASVRRDL